MRNSFLIITVASAATAFALTLPQLWFGAPLGLALLYLAIDYARTRNEAFILGLVFGIVTGGAAIWWAWDALPFLWLGYTSPWDGAYVMALIWGLVSVGLGVPLALYGVILFLLRGSWYGPALMVLLWPAVEWGRMWSFALLAAGENALIGPHFSFAALGYLLVDTAFLPAAHQGGVYALSLVIALMSVCIYTIGTRKRGWIWWALISFGLLAIMGTHTYTAPTIRPATLALVHTIRHDAPDLPLSYESVLQTAREADLIVFPEDLYMFGSSTPEGVVETVETDSLIAFPYREHGEESLYRTFVVLADRHGIQSRFQKQFLMPEGEYSPFLSQWIFRLIGDPRVEGYFGSVRRLQQGEDAAALSYANMTIRGRMCSDIISPELTQRFDTHSASLIINIGDQTWFNTSPLLHERLKQMARVRAVETESYVVVANRGSPSYGIDPYGTLLAESIWGEEGILYVDLH